MAGPVDPRLVGRAAEVRGLLALDAGTGIVSTLLLLTQVTLLAGILAGVVAGDAGALDPALLLAVVALVAARSGAAQLTERAGRRAAARVMSSLRRQLLERRLARGGTGADDLDTAATAAAAVQGVDGLETYFARYLPQLVLAVVVPVAALVWIAAVDPVSALIVAVTLPLIPLFMWLIGRATEARADRHLHALEALAGHFLDLVRGLGTLRAFNRGRAQGPAIEATTERFRTATMATLRLSFLSGFVLDLATTLSIALVAVTLGVRLIGGSLELRPALTVLLLVPELYAPVRSVGAQYHASADGLAAARRILDALDEADARTVGPTGDATPGPRTAAPRSTPAGVELVGVHVAFPDRPEPALDAVDLTIGPDELLVVEGPSGAGKTTLGRVLVGLVAPTGGEVLVDGVPLDELGATVWRERVGWAAPRPAVVRGTVAENVALGRPDLGASAVRRALEAAGASDVVDDLPDGDATLIGAGARQLSAGQRQRVGLARALVRDPDLLVLDEPTAHLDPAAAAHVVDTVAALRGSRAIVVLTHDPRFRAVADAVVEVTAGRVRRRPAAGSGS